MPHIYDNIDRSLLPALRETLSLADRADFCVGYFNLRGWKKIDESIDRFSGGPGHCCRLLIGMQRLPQDELRDAFSIIRSEQPLDNQTAIHLKKRLAEDFRNQLMIGLPTNQDEAGLRRLARQIRAKKVVVKLYLRHTLHAKLYLLFRPDPITPTVGFLGSSNLTFAGLQQQGELNVDVVEQDACQKLAKWFEERWDDQWCLDITKELLEVIDESWAREKPIPPYHIYLKMAYHLSQEAREGLKAYSLPKDFRDKLFAFQEAAVKIAAHHLHKRGGVVIGDVVGLGKTLMATAVARIFEDDHSLETLILCPKNLISMWEDYRHTFGLRGRVLSITKAIKELPERVKRYRLVLIDESHNLRNREGKIYHVIQDYIQRNQSKVILLSATPYNKNFQDLGNQLRLFLPGEQDLGIRPEAKIREMTETGFQREHQCPLRSLAAFEKSDYADDWRELMRLYLVRRTRSFIQANYAEVDPATGRKSLRYPSGEYAPFPKRVPKTIKFDLRTKDPSDQYAALYAAPVVDAINRLTLPRYGLGNYLLEEPQKPPTAAESRIMQDLSRAGKRLMGFCRTNLFKRLESSGQAFLQSLERHVLRNYVYLHALENGLPLPIGTQDSAMVDERFQDEDRELFADQEEREDADEEAQAILELKQDAQFRDRAGEIYAEYTGPWKKRFRWLSPARFLPLLTRDLKADNEELLAILKRSGPWDAARDEKLAHLVKLIEEDHPGKKILVFTQFADTVYYLADQLEKRRIPRAAGVTGSSAEPTRIAHRFSPRSNAHRGAVAPEDELTVLVATDVLSEGQNLQDAAIVVNYDLPWAIIRLIQRAGRVDRIGQKAEEILCYSFLPADGVEQIIRLRSRVRQRLRENAEVVGSDEAFFDDGEDVQAVRDLFTEKSGILDGEAETEVDLSSFAWQIWKNAIDADPSLAKLIPDLPDVVFSTRAHQPAPGQPPGVLAYVRTAEGNDALAWVDTAGQPVTQSQFAILKAAECGPETPAISRQANHHELVAKAVEQIAAEERGVGGQLGRPAGARFRAYERLKQYATDVKGSIFDTHDLRQAVEDIYNFPLRHLAVQALNRLLKSGVRDEELADAVIKLRTEGRLSIIHEQEETQEPHILCSLGLAEEK